MDILSSPVSASATNMLDALALQQKILARNIANANVEGYRPSYLNFDSYMAAATLQDQAEGNSHIRPSEHLTVKSDNVQLDMELLKMQETVLHYKTLLDLLSRKGALMKTVISGVK